MRTDLDLNLLLLLDALLDEGSVTAAAERLDMSVPAASRALGRLRKAVGDPVLVRAGQKLVPTPWALSVQGRVNEVVNGARSVINEPAGLDLDLLERDFLVTANDLLFPASQLIARLRREAPHSNCAVVELVEGTVPLRDAFDLAVGVVRDFDPALRFEPEVVMEVIGTDTIVGIAREDHPLFEGEITTGAYLAADHLVNSRRGRLFAPIDHELADLGLRRRIVASVSTTWSMVGLLRETNLLGTVNQRVGDSLASNGLRTFKLPVEVNVTSEISQAWHPRFSADPAHQWLRRMVREVMGAAA